MDNKYDILIIGAGVGGLICGNYLAKAGLKVLIIEQNKKPGGYCGSFERLGYRFDIGVHYLGGIKSILGKILSELGLRDEIIFDRFDPVDKIVLPNNVTYIYTNPKHTIEGFKEKFPKEKKNIERFFKFIMQENFFNVYKKIKNMPFQKILYEFFDDYKVRATLEVLLLNLGISAKKASAIASVVLYRDYILDGGYYPRGGMQGFSDALANRFKKFKGDLLLGKKVVEILIQKKEIKGIMLDGGEEVKGNIIVSNVDASQTFKQLLRNSFSRERTIVEKLSCSNSIFALYIGIEKDLKFFTKDTCNIWSFDSFDIDNYVSNLKESLLMPNLPFITINFPSSHTFDVKIRDKNTIQFLLIAPFETKTFWDSYKDEIAEKIIKRTEKIFPNLEKYIKVKTIATPATFYKYTLNKDGAAFGWSSTVNQTKASIFPQKSSLDNLYLVGHWCTIGSGQGGVPKAIFSGRKVSHLIINRMNKKWQYDKI